MKNLVNQLINYIPLIIRKKLFYAIQRSIRGDIARQYLCHNKTVLDGEFKGMKLIDDVSVQNYTLAHMLGVYEPNIQKLIIDRIDDYNRFVDVGCASGVFSVGVPFVSGKESVGFDVDQKQVHYANDLATLNRLEDRVRHYHISLNEDYNTHLKPNDFCLVDIEGGEINFIKSINKDLLSQIAFVIEIHEIGSKNVQAVLNDLIAIMKETHEFKVLNEEFHLDLEPIAKLQSISRNDSMYFANGQRDYFQKWVIFEPK